jgi:uncharacterized protein (DUF3084 family)
MSEKTELVARIRVMLKDYPATVEFCSEELQEAADEIEQLRDERDAALTEISILRQDRDAARADASCAHDRINLLQNEVRL